MIISKEEYQQARSQFVDWVKAQLSGSHLLSLGNDNAILHKISPLERFPIAVLFPIDTNGDGLDPAQQDDIESDEPDTSVSSLQGSSDKSDNAEPVKRRRYVPPSSVGFSFYFANTTWEIQVIATAMQFSPIAEFAPDERLRLATGEYVGVNNLNYRPRKIGGDDEALMITTTGFYPVCYKDGQPLAGIDVRSYPHNTGVIVTVSLVNHQQIDSNVKNETWRLQQIERALFDVKLDCYIQQGEVGNYPSVDYALLSEADQEIELQYAHKKVYAVGHGAAVRWELNTIHSENSLDTPQVTSIHSEFMPTEEVPQVTADIKDPRLGDVLSMVFLATTDKNTTKVCQQLTQFIDLYSRWIGEQEDSLSGIEVSHIKAGQRIIGRMHTAYQRMKAGIHLIQTDPLVAQAFAFANRAMLMQMQQSNRLANAERDCNWRAFQLAFILTSMVSTTDSEDEFRKAVDLIWFPTGGGKTEAYLGLTAYLIAYRRLRYREAGGGMTALMRYTLRLLTTQQFTRACRMICALEILRRELVTINPFDPQQSVYLLGKEPITIGLWVGGDTSPNTIAKAQDKYQKIAQLGRPATGQTAKNNDTQLLSHLSYFVITKCPWCDTPFDHNNLVFGTHQFHFHCHNSACNFGQHPLDKLPCNVVDEMLYKEPPTLLVATLDKFARLVWEEKTQAFFGYGEKRPPELIIQDELHLIASALGSVAGVYEAGLETLLNLKGIKPKYIASTATIKEAQDQVKKLFGKDLMIFPPQGLDADDAFFAKTVDLKERAGRLYVGYFAPLFNRQKNLAPLASALLLAPEFLFGENQQHLLDNYWTQLVYHGSLKGVGNSHNAFTIIVKAFYDRLVDELSELASGNASQQGLSQDNTFEHNSSQETGYYDDQENWQVITTPKSLSQNQGLKKQRDEALYQRLQPRRHVKISQLTSNASAQENASTFDKLRLTQDEEGNIDVVLATNMVSVGLDVSRLALMVINGQPLTTAEYIQASSRVGRSDVPGIVYINYYRDQARSLSHYENFRPYHQSFYRYVEPTSVTPFTYQSRKRALHAGLVLALRQGIATMLDNNGAMNFDPNNPLIQQAIDLFTERCGRADEQRRQAISEHIQKLTQEWQMAINNNQKNNRRLSYDTNKDRAKDGLLYPHGEEKTGIWATLHSMRNVENTGILKVLKSHPNSASSPTNSHQG